MNKIHDRMISYLPSYEQDSKVFIEILKAIAIELKNKSDGIDDFINQLFIDSATWGLDYWEKNLSLSINKSLSYQERRKIIKSKLRVNYNINDLMIEAVINALTNGRVDAVFTQKGIIEIDLSTLGASEINLLEISKVIEEMKQTFFDYEFRIIFEQKNPTVHMASASQFAEITTIYPRQERNIKTEATIYTGIAIDTARETITIYPREG